MTWEAQGFRHVRSESCLAATSGRPFQLRSGLFHFPFLDACRNACSFNAERAAALTKTGRISPAEHPGYARRSVLLVSAPAVSQAASAMYREERRLDFLISTATPF